MISTSSITGGASSITGGASSITGEPRANSADEVLLGFTTALRHAGLAVTPDRAHSFLIATVCLGAGDPDRARAAGRATLCASPEDLARFDQVFDAYFNARDGLPRRKPSEQQRRMSTYLPDTDSSAGADETGDNDPLLIQAAASTAEVLRHRDVASLTAAEKAHLEYLFAHLNPVAPRRRSMRATRARRGSIDAARTVRASMRHLGEPARLQFRRRQTRERRVVVLIDVSGSMGVYADALLRVAHRMVSELEEIEVFAMGTRLTHLTRALSDPDPERALIAAGGTVPDWSGGTRLAETLRAFERLWGRRGMARGAVVVIISDGWERGEVADLAEQTRRLQRLSHRLVWVNPHRGKTGYQPLQRGIVAVLPYLDKFVAGHSLATYRELCEVIADA